MHLSHLNYITFEGHGADWNVKLKPTCKSFGTWKDESIRAAQIIQEQAKGPITLLFSGGIDSQFMIRTFQEAGVDFNIGIIEYADHLNKHDIKYALQYCVLNKIDPIIKTVDVGQLIDSGEYEHIAREAKCYAHQMIPVMKGLTLFDDTVIMANGEPYFKNYYGEWRWQETERVNSYNNWYRLNDIDGTPDFLRYTSEMVKAFTHDPIVQKLINNQMPGKLSTRTSKHRIYNVNHREKYTGWESVTDALNEKALDIMQELSVFNGTYELTVEELMKRL